ncbi:MAG: hypothetical protein A2497_05080 [Candidatus Firestonebacteria bacterium RifOxyC12_full_39_7]|nr:MAG: hypothetical protein A2497_05080 [Candidatus Firestonebacteria bacterium RifOxyC12_full_39_7]
MFDATDPGTVLRLCNWRISRIQWNLFTKAIASPDYTKLVHLSDMLGNGNYYFCIMRLPDAPKELKASKQQGGVKLEWKIPERHAELKGYNIYKSNKSGNGFKRLNLKVISETAYLDTESGSETGFYMVAAEEYSGLEGFLSREASAGGLNGPVILHYEAEECEKTLPMREVLDGYASGYRSMRVTKVAEGEDSGSLTINPGIFKKGSYLIWARCKNASGGDGKFSLKVQGKETAVLKGVTGDWSWIKSTAEVSMSPGDKLLLVSNDDGLAVDKIVITNDNSYKPVGCDDRKGKPAAVLEFKASEVTANSVKLEWKPNMDSDLYYYSVYVSEKPDFSLDNETVLCSGEKTIALDWGIKSNTKYCYKVVAVDKRGNMSDPVTLEVKTSGLEIVTKDIESGKAKLSSSLKTGTTEGVNFVEFPKDAVSGNQSLTFDLDIIKDGSYYFWIENSPRQIGARTVKVLADGKDVGYWSAREPLRLGSAAEVKLEDARWFVERLSIAPNIWGNGVWKSYLNFNTGKHTLTIEFDEKKAGLTPLISKIWYSNDASFIPPGYNVQARFNKLKRQ